MINIYVVQDELRFTIITLHRFNGLDSRDTNGECLNY